jgi:hypothetical protein
MDPPDHLAEAEQDVRYPNGIGRRQAGIGAGASDSSAASAAAPSPAASSATPVTMMAAGLGSTPVRPAMYPAAASAMNRSYIRRE